MKMGREFNGIIFAVRGRVLSPVDVYIIAEENLWLFNKNHGLVDSRFYNERHGIIRGLVYHDKKVYYCGTFTRPFFSSGGEGCQIGEAICDLVSGEEVGWRASVKTITSHNGKLYDAGKYGGIYETFTPTNFELPSFAAWLGDPLSGITTIYGKRIKERKEDIETNVYALISHDGNLYDGGCSINFTNDTEKGFIYKTFSDEKIAVREDGVRAMISHNGKMYDAGWYDKIYETFVDREIIKRNNSIESLCSHNGLLFDGGEYDGLHITDTESKRHYILFPELKNITAIVGVNSDFLEKILKCAKRVCKKTK